MGAQQWWGSPQPRLPLHYPLITGHYHLSKAMGVNWSNQIVLPSDVGHSHHQLIIEKMRHFTSVGSYGTALWSAFGLHVALKWRDMLQVRRFDLCQGWESFHLLLCSQCQLRSSCFSVTAAAIKVFYIHSSALTVSVMSRCNKFSAMFARNEKELASNHFWSSCTWAQLGPCKENIQ